MTKTIGVAVPCYKHHVKLLLRMLQSIEENSIKPEIVIISCSSMDDEELILPEYSFPVRLILHKERKNAAENRNIAAAQLTTDIVSFFDADDIMHPQRIEFILNAFNKYDCKIVLHNFYETYNSVFTTYDTAAYEYGVLERAPSGCAIVKYNWRSLIHHSQVSVLKDVLDKIKFIETADHERREDAVFCGHVLAEFPGDNVYISNKLSAYECAGKWY